MFLIVFITIGATCLVASTIAAFVKYLAPVDTTLLQAILTHDFIYLFTLPMTILSTAPFPIYAAPYLIIFPPYAKELNPPVAIEVAMLKTFWIA